MYPVVDVIYSQGWTVQ